MHDTAIEMAKRLLVDSIWKSANLEGLGTTFSKTEAILANAPTTTKSEEVLFVINMKRAWQFLLDNIDSPNNIMLLREYNKIVGELLFRNNGEIRTFAVQIGGTAWEPELPDITAISTKLQEIDKIADIELKALKYLCFTARTQIFIDGNKRVAQLITNKILIENEQSDIYSILRHSTSYKFYKKLLDQNYLTEGYDFIEFEENLPEL